MTKLERGIVSEIDGAASKIRCRFPDRSNMQSYWLPVLLPFTSPDSAYVMPSVGEAVACLMDEKSEAGFVLGMYYHAKQTPPTSNPREIRAEMASGDFLSYDRDTGIATLEVKELVIKALKVDITGLTTIALNTPLLLLNVAQISSSPSGSYGAPDVQMEIQSLELDAASYIKLNPGTPLTINTKEAAVLGGRDSDNDVLVESGQD